MEMVSGKLRRIIARNQTFNSFDSAIGDSVIFFKLIGMSLRKWRARRQLNTSNPPDCALLRAQAGHLFACHGNWGAG